MDNTHTGNPLPELARLIRYYILAATTEAASGHPSSSLSATDLMTALLFGGVFRFDAAVPQHPNNDRLIFSKGHAAPLLYALWAAAGQVSLAELMSLRKFGSRLEGHPAVTFPYTEAATGSLGQGLSIGVGMALNAKYLDRLPYRTFVLLGDSEMAEGSQWEAIQIAAHYQLGNLVGILDVNRLGQRGETMYGHDLGAYARRIGSFGWETIVIDGHHFPEILAAYEKTLSTSDRPVMIIAKTIKGKGVPFMEDKDGWHGKALDKEQFAGAMEALGAVDTSLRGRIARPDDVQPETTAISTIEGSVYAPGKPLATRRAYGEALAGIFIRFPAIVALDGEVGNSTYAEIFRNTHPKRFFEMYIAEQNMVGCAAGLAARGKIPFVSTFAAFFSRAFDQIRMSAYSRSNIKFVGSHSGVSIGEDGPSQMGLEDIAMFRAVHGSVVLYPCDAISTEKLVERAAEYRGMVYIRTTRMEAPLLYPAGKDFSIGGSETLHETDGDRVAVVTAGTTVFAALDAWATLAKEDIAVRVIDLYSIKPLDFVNLRKAAQETGRIITVEDHYPEGGLGEAVQSALAGNRTPVHILAVHRMPGSGKPAELLDYESISARAIVEKVREIL